MYKFLNTFLTITWFNYFECWWVLLYMLLYFISTITPMGNHCICIFTSSLLFRNWRLFCTAYNAHAMYVDILTMASLPRLFHVSTYILSTAFPYTMYLIISHRFAILSLNKSFYGFHILSHFLLNAIFLYQNPPPFY